MNCNCVGGEVSLSSSQLMFCAPFPKDDYGCMDIEVIFGCNGLVWVGLPTRKASGPSTFHPDTAPESAAHKPCSRVIRTVRKLICRVANAARILAALSLSVESSIYC